MNYQMEIVVNGGKGKPLKRQSRLQQTTNFVTSFLIFEKKIRYDIAWEYRVICYFLKKQQNLKLSSAENYMWRFIG